MEIEIVRTTTNGWARLYINGEYIGKDIRITKDDFFNNDIKIKKTEITGYEKKYNNGFELFEEKKKIIAEYEIKGD